MITQIAIIILVLVLLYLLLRHWPETAGERPAWANPVVPKTKKLKKETAEATPPRLSFGADQIQESAVGRLWGSAQKLWQRKPKATEESLRAESALNKAFQKVAKPVNDEFADFIGLPSEPVKPAASGREEGVDVLLSRAEASERNGKFTEAEKMLIKAATLEPKNPKIYSRLGILYLEQGENWKEAEESFRQALKYDNANGFIHNNLGLVLYNQDRFAAGAKEFEQACKTDDTIASRHANLGLCYLSLRQYTKAEQEFKRASRLDPKNEEYQELSREAAAKRKSHRAA